MNPSKNGQGFTNEKGIRSIAAGGMMAVGATAHAADMASSEFGLMLGGGWADADLTGDRDSAGDVNPLIGLRYGRRLGSDFNFFGDLVYGPYSGDRAGVGDSDVTTLRGGLEWLFSKQDRYDWFLSGGLGVMNVNTDDGPDFTRPMASLVSASPGKWARTMPSVGRCALTSRSATTRCRMPP